MFHSDRFTEIEKKEINFNCTFYSSRCLKRSSFLYHIGKPNWNCIFFLIIFIISDKRDENKAHKKVVRVQFIACMTVLVLYVLVVHSTWMRYVVEISVDFSTKISNWTFYLWPKPVSICKRHILSILSILSMHKCLQFMSAFEWNLSFAIELAIETTAVSLQLAWEKIFVAFFRAFTCNMNI